MNLHGFVITEKKNINGAEFTEMKHVKTNARLGWFNNKDENKLFSISFRTVPEDDTGVFHILEHSVLGGSENYPVKEPFLYMLKSSMNTFLNAMTFPDKTMFPISSRNNTDFMNLTKVYLDAVFKPLIYKNPCIFYQEGHHTEYHAEGDNPSYKGVVFNEMKGVMSSVHERMESTLMEMLYPESCYRFSYGGNPVSIPDLTYEKFIETHKRFYHPSNSYIWLDGDVDIEKVLELIDSYLSEYEKADGFPEIAVQEKTEYKERTEYYEISPEEPEEKHAHLVMGKILAPFDDVEKTFAYNILCEALTGSNDSPLKRSLLNSGLCLDADLSLTDGILQHFGMLEINNIDDSDSKKIISAVNDIVKNIVDNGIGKEILLASINRAEFNFIESEEPQGLTRCIDAMSSWLYGENPLLYIDCGSVFESLRKKADTGYFEELLAEWLLNKDGMAVLHMLPSRTYGNELKKAEQERLDKELSLMTDKEKSELIELNEQLDEWQKNPDNPEDVAKIPSLSLSEVSENPIDYKTTESSENGVKILSHPAKNKGIICLNFWFDVSDMSRHELEIISLLDMFLAELPTKKSTGLELTQKVIGILGNLSSNITAVGKPESPEKCKVYFNVRTRFLERNLSKALELISEIITETVYDNPELISEIISQDKEDSRQSIISSGHRVAMMRAKSGLSAESAVNELINGYEAYRFIRDVDDEQISGIIEEIIALSERIFCKSRLTIGITSSESVSVAEFTDNLPCGEKCVKEEISLCELDMEYPEKQTVIIPSGVSYTGAVLSTKTNDMALWDVLSTILTYEYLWNEVRVKGGAYGTGATTNVFGENAFYSFRDPSPLATIETFRNCSAFLNEYCAEKPDITNYIISTIAKGEPLVSDAAYGTSADILYFRGIDYNKRKATRKRILSLTYNDLQNAFPDIEKIGAYCIVGSEAEEGVKTYEL